MKSMVMANNPDMIKELIKSPSVRSTQVGHSYWHGNETVRNSTCRYLNQPFPGNLSTSSFNYFLSLINLKASLLLETLACIFSIFFFLLDTHTPHAINLSFFYPYSFGLQWQHLRVWCRLGALPTWLVTSHQQSQYLVIDRSIQ